MKNWILSALLVGAVGCFVGCENEGPIEEAAEEIGEGAEKAGEKIDEAGKDAKRAIEDAAD